MAGVTLKTRLLIRVEKAFDKFRFWYRDVQFRDGLLTYAAGEFFVDIDPKLFEEDNVREEVSLPTPPPRAAPRKAAPRKAAARQAVKRKKRPS